MNLKTALQKIIIDIFKPLEEQREETIRRVIQEELKVMIDEVKKDNDFDDRDDRIDRVVNAIKSLEKTIKDEASKV
jgi:hypothetical protein